MNRGSVSEEGLRKRLLRKELLARRRALPADQHSAASEAIVRQLVAVLAGPLDCDRPQDSARCVALYWPIQGEPDVSSLPTLLSNIEWALPVVVRRDHALEFHRWSGSASELREGGFGTRVPKRQEVVVPDVLVVPLVGFDSRGYRIGYGGGYYDRTLATMAPSPFVIGVGFELSRLDELPVEAHDRRMDRVLTERTGGAESVRSSALT